jgi:hypothetical protein
MTTAKRFNPHVYPGQRVVTAAGTVAVVAFIAPDGRTYVHGARGIPEPARIAFDALGGESTLAPGANVATCIPAGPPSPGPRFAGSRRGLRLAA